MHLYSYAFYCLGKLPPAAVAKCHYHGVESVRAVVEGCAEIGVQWLTLYAFSTENWDRPEAEVNGLMSLLVDTIKKEVPILNKNNIKLHVIGNTAQLPAFAQQELKEALQETSSNTGLNLVMALSYSSRWELTEAVKSIAIQVQNNTLNINEVTQATITQHLQTSLMPEPELMIRTSGEHRISNFLLYQLAYTELYFTDVHWPVFRKPDLYQAIHNYQQRQRRFGKTDAQLTNI